MERITLSIPRDLRSELQKMAQEQDRPEADLVRELLRRAIDTERREAFYQAVSRAMSPEASRRMVELARVVEAAGGEPR